MPTSVVILSAFDNQFWFALLVLFCSSESCNMPQHQIKKSRVYWYQTCVSSANANACTARHSYG